MPRIQFILFISFFHLHGLLIAQTGYEAETISTVDEIVGYQNTGLYNGTKYIELYRTINERHKFFLSREFMKGNLVYDNRYYGNVNLKYDLDADDILLDIGYKWKFPILKLYKDRISKFSLGGKKFINIGAEATDITKGFHEILWSSRSISLLKKHQKKKFRRIFNTVVYFEFDDDISYYFSFQNEFYPLRKKGDLTRVFPEQKKVINRLYKKKLVKIDPDANLILIFGQLQNALQDEDK